jgi:hypothetical protein
MTKDGKRYCRFLWNSWSPEWKFSEEDFSISAQSWNNADWAEVSIHAYLHRWGRASGDPALEQVEEHLKRNPPVMTPTLVLDGTGDCDNFPQTSEGKERYFPTAYERKLIANAAG